MKRLVAALALSTLLWSCGGDKGTNDPPDKPDSTWTPVESYSLIAPGADYLLLESPYLYAVGRGGLLCIFNISDPDTVTLTGMLPGGTPDSKTPAGYGARAMAKRGNYLYVAFYATWNMPSSVQVFDVSNPAAPTAVCELLSNKISPQLGNDYVQFTGLAVLGDTLLVQSHGYGYLYRIAGPNSFLILDTIGKEIVEPSCQTGGITAWDYDAGHLYAHGTCTQTGQDFLFWAVIRGSMQVAGRLDMSAGPDLSGNVLLRVFGDKAYLWQYQGDNNVVEIDVSNPAAPSFVRSQALTFVLDGIISPRLSGLIKANDRFVFLDSYEGILMACDSMFHILRFDADGLAYDAVFFSGRVYSCGEFGIRVYSLP